MNISMIDRIPVTSTVEIVRAADFQLWTPTVPNRPSTNVKMTNPNSKE